MPSISFTFDASVLIANGLRVVLVLLITLIVLAIMRRALPRIIHARIPRLHEESRDQLALRSDTVSRAATQAVSFVIWTVSLITILAQIGVNIAPILATVGVAGLAVGFAAQNIVRDFLNGLFILIEDWYRVGEVASVGGQAGVVVDISLRRTVLRDLSGRVHIVPNSQINQASNLTRDWARINLNVPVAYGTNIDDAFRVINAVGEEMKEDGTWGPDLITAPQAVRLDSFGESGMEVLILADTKPMRQWALTGELRKRLKERFDREGIEIPWPHTKVYFGNAVPEGQTAESQAKDRAP